MATRITAGKLPLRYRGVIAIDYPQTPDGRYFVVRGRLWRRTNPDLPEAERQKHVNALMSARSAVRLARRAGDTKRLSEARSAVDAAKIALGERGPVWWRDGAPDLNRHMARTTVYAEWLSELPEAIEP